jgi:hypothetical protein
LAFGCLLTLSSSCARTPAPAVEDLRAGKPVSAFSLASFTGTRDGERVSARAQFQDGARTLTVLLEFKVDPQPHLQTGTWEGLENHGTVRERAATFLGGQSGPPSLGGRFDLIGPDGSELYRVTIPLQPLIAR